MTELGDSAKLESIKDLHRKAIGDYHDRHGHYWAGEYCVACKDEWPCETAAILGAS